MAHISPYLNTNEAAVYLHFAPKSLVNMRVLHIGPKYSRAGKSRILYHIEDIENWIVRVDHIKPEVA